MKEKRKTSLELTAANRCERLLAALPYDARLRVLVYLRAMVDDAQPPVPTFTPFSTTIEPIR